MTLPTPILVNALRKLRIRLPQLKQENPADRQELEEAVRIMVRDLHRIPSNELLHLDGPEFIHNVEHLQAMQLELNRHSLQLSTLSDWNRLTMCLHTVLNEALGRR